MVSKAEIPQWCWVYGFKVVTDARDVKHRPIMFKPPMVRAILEGRKSQTRRPVKFVAVEPGLNFGYSGLSAGEYDTGNMASGAVLYSRGCGGVWQQRTEPLRSPYGLTGDRLWVKETWYDDNALRHQEATPTGPDEFVFYRADGEAHTQLEDHDGFRWRPSIHMPRWASRLTLEITSVRVERVEAISEEDARAEGFRTAERFGVAGVSARESFLALWRSLYGGGQ